MPNIYILATCQTPTLEFLARRMVPGGQVWVTDFLDHTSYREDALAGAAARMDQADLILAQHGGFGPLSLKEIKEKHPTKAHGLATVYFQGLHPDGCYVGSVGDNFQDPSLYHSLAVLEAFRRGKSASWAIQHAFTFENFERLGLMTSWEDSLHEIENLDRLVDFPIAAHIDRYCRAFPGFLTFNHPTIQMLHPYLMGVFKQLGITAQSVDLTATQDPLGSHDICPVHDFVAEHYGLPYRTSQHWLLAHAGKYIDREGYIRRFYEAYRKIDPQKLTVDAPTDFVDRLRGVPKLSSLAPSSA